MTNVGSGLLSLVVKPPTREWINQPWDDVINGQIPITPEKSETMSKINSAIDVIVEKEGNNKIEREPQRIGDSISAFSDASIPDIPKRRKDNNIEHNHGSRGILLVIIRKSCDEK
jgi:hypothetical protein